MKKNILTLVIGLSCLVLVGCGKKVVTTNTDTGTVITGEQVTTGTQSGDMFLDTSNNLREEITGDIQTGSLVITGATGTITTGAVATGQIPTSGTVASGTKVTTGKVTDQVKTLIQERATKPVDDKKLTEDDIDLIQQVIQKIESIGD